MRIEQKSNKKNYFIYFNLLPEDRDAEQKSYEYA